MYAQVIAKERKGDYLGKCWGADTKLLMYDGSVKCVEEIVRDCRAGVDQLLMGDDSTPRRVCPQSALVGVGEMFQITSQEDDGRDAWTCNADHILVLKLERQPWVQRAHQDSTEFAVHGYTLVPGQDDQPGVQPSSVPKQCRLAGPFETMAEADAALAPLVAKWQAPTFECTVRDCLKMTGEARAHCAMFQPDRIDFAPIAAHRQLATMVEMVAGAKVPELATQETAWSVAKHAHRTRAI